MGTQCIRGKLHRAMIMADTQPPPLPVSPTDDLVGRRLGDFQVVRCLGQGGMAHVYLAEQSSLGRQVALKVLKRRLADDDACVQRFHREARAAAALVHANIVQIYEVGHIDGIHFIALEYVRGRNLQQMLTSREHHLEAATAVRILRQVAAALHKAGQHQIVHRDIKPENILLSAEGDVKVADFGLARVQAEADVGLTQDNMTLGTPLYMSPEQAQGRKLDPRSDIYSLGVTTFEMLAGRTPFCGDTALSVALQHVQNEPPQLDVIRPDLPDRLCTVVHKMLAKAPIDRQQSAAELLRELRAAMEHAATVAGDDWPDDLLQWSTSELAALNHVSTYRTSAATQQLAAVMKTEEQLALRPRHRLGRFGRFAAALGAVLLAVFAVGGALAWFTAPSPLLKIDPADLPKVPRMKTVTEQYYYAAVTRTLPAWNAIPEYFPPDQSGDNLRYARLATRRKAEMFTEQGQWREALKQFTELANLEETEEELITIGLAGQALAFAQLGEEEKAKVKLAQVLAPSRRRHLRFDSEISTQIGKLAVQYGVKVDRDAR